MAVKALGKYDIPARDRQEVFGDDQLVYLYVPNNYWFCSAACFRAGRAMSFEAFWETMLAPFVHSDSNLAGRSWRDGRWQLNGEPFTPDPERSLAAQGIGHKSLLTWTPNPL
jgi:phenol hydroxylase P4 protein